MLLITSVYIDFLLIRASGAVLRIRAKSSAREIAAAVMGSIFSLVLLLPKLNVFFLFLLRGITAVIIMLIAYGFSGKANLIKRTAVFLAVSLCFSGVCFFLAENVGENLIYCRNGGVYLNISVWVLLISTALAYAGIYLFRIFTGEKTYGKYTVTVYSAENKYASFPASVDTGNYLTDMITGIPVIVCGKEQLENAFGAIPEKTEELIGGWRLIPYNTAGNSGLIPIIRPKEVFIRNDETRHTICAEAYIGIADVKMDTAVFNPVLLRDS